MKLKIKDLKPNPFKKQIDGGKLNSNQVEKIKASIKELGLMGTIPVFKKGKYYHQISHHHRTQAIKELYGSDFKVEVIIHKYNDDQALRGMVMENLTQRTDDFKEVVHNLNCVRGHLKKNPACSESEQANRKDIKGIKDAGSIRHLAEWLNKSGMIMSIGAISEHLRVADNLNEELYERLEKTHLGEVEKRTDGNTISKTQAVIIAKLKDKEEQKDIADALLTSREQRVRTQSELVTKYKEADDEVKEKIRKGEKDIADVRLPKELQNLKINLSTEKLIMERHIELRKGFGILSEHLKDFTKQNNDKQYIRRSSQQELKLTYHYIYNWIRDDLIPFTNEIIKELQKREENKDVMFFEVKEKS